MRKNMNRNVKVLLLKLSGLDLCMSRASIQTFLPRALSLYTPCTPQLLRELAAALIRQKSDDWYLRLGGEEAEKNAGKSGNNLQGKILYNLVNIKAGKKQVHFDIIYNY